MKTNRRYTPGAEQARGIKSIMNHERYFCENCGSYYDDYRRQDASEYDDEK